MSSPIAPVLLQPSPTPQLALFGIRIHSALLPAAVALLATLLFWLRYDLTTEMVTINKKKLEEMGLQHKQIGGCSSGEWSAATIPRQKSPRRPAGVSDG